MIAGDMKPIISIERTLLIAGAVAALAVAASCGESPTVRLPNDEGTCIAAAEACGDEHGYCCAGMFCEAGPYTPEVGRCLSQRADGEFCTSAVECASGVCETNLCG